MEPKNEILQPGFKRVNSPEIKEEERFAESLDRSLTNDLEENADLQLKKEAER